MVSGDAKLSWEDQRLLRGVHGDSEHKGNIITPLYNSYDTKTKKLLHF